jgi:glycosyltransferase involved in cell wall biosynthesis
MIGQDADEVMIRLLERSMVGTLGGLQTSSHANADFWLRHGAKNVVVIPPAVAVPPLPSLPVCSSGLVVGRLQRWKGPDILCGALRLMGSEAPRTRWIGRDVAWTARGQMASRHLATSYPDVWGMLLHHSPPRPHSEVFRLQGGALFNLTPSTWDVFNLTVAEGMASGRPCIASDGAGAAELIDDGESGFLFKAGQSASLAEAIERVLSTSPARLKQIGLSARAVVEARLNPFESAKLRAAAYATARSEFTSRQSAGIDPWLRNACTPRVAQAEIDAAFLTHHPLRLLIRHALARVRGRTATLLRRRTWEA